MFTITKPELFEPHAYWATSSLVASSARFQEQITTPGYATSKQNPSKKDLALGYYKPHLTLLRRIRPLQGYKTLLKIEISLPKLLFGTGLPQIAERSLQN